MDTLTLRYQPDPDDDFGRLHVAVSASGFAGQGFMWVQWQDVEAFATSLAAFPLPADPPPRLKYGFNKLAGDDLRIGITIRPIDARGTLLVDAEIADYIEPERRVRTTFHANYPQIETFQRQIVRMMKRERDDAILTSG